MIRSYYQHSCSWINFHNLWRGTNTDRCIQSTHTGVVRVYLLTWADYNISMSLGFSFKLPTKGSRCLYSPSYSLSHSLSVYQCIMYVSTRVITYVSFRFRLGRCHTVSDCEQRRNPLGTPCFCALASICLVNCLENIYHIQGIPNCRYLLASSQACWLPQWSAKYVRAPVPAGLW